MSVSGTSVRFLLSKILVLNDTLEKMSFSAVLLEEGLFVVTPSFDYSTRLGFWLLLSFLHKLQASNHQIPSNHLCGSN